MCGKLLSGERLGRIKKSPNYKKGQFQNTNYTPTIAEGVSMFTVLKEFFFGKNKNGKPPGLLPSKKTNLLNSTVDRNRLVWFGHSSYFVQSMEKRFLLILSGSASPLSFTTKSYPGSDVYLTDDLPEIDYLFISHDHWYHLDYKAILQLRAKTKKAFQPQVLLAPHLHCTQNH